MKVVKKFEFAPSTFGQSTHDWDAILAAKVEPSELGKPGAAVCLVEGEDFEGKPQQMVSMVRNQAAKRHLKAKCSIVPGKKEGDKAHIYVQVCDMTDEEAASADARFDNAKERGKQRPDPCCSASSHVCTFSKSVVPGSDSSASVVVATAPSTSPASHWSSARFAAAVPRAITYSSNERPGSAARRIARR